MQESFDIPEEDRIKFIHFENINKCREFIQHFGANHIKSTCCEGKGFGYINTSENNTRIDMLQRRIQQQLRDYPIRHITERVIQRQEPLRDYPIIVRKENPLETDCCVCLNTNKRFTKCSHNLCQSCESKITTRLCPICRQMLDPR